MLALLSLEHVFVGLNFVLMEQSVQQEKVSQFWKRAAEAFC